MEWIDVADYRVLQEKKKLQIRIADHPIALFCIADEVFAIDDTCSHAEAYLSEGELVDYEVSCPLHGARFDVRTGQQVSFPAVVPVNAYACKVENDRVFIDVSEEKADI
jgi:nitrite reductase/ring-hydroxylating ferredoxin subunit